MPHGLKGRALREFIGVTGVKIRRMQNADVEPLSSRLARALERLGIADGEKTRETAAGASKTGKSDGNDNTH